MSNFITRKYKEFYYKHGYIPKMFNPYNCTEITNIAPALLTNCGITTSSSTVLIVVEEKEDFQNKVDI